MRDFRPDVVLSYWAHPDGDVAVRMAARHGVPSVVMVGGSDVLLLARSGSRRRAILNVLHRSDAVVTVSDHIAQTLASDGIDLGKLRVVRRGVDQTVFSPGDRKTSRRGLGLPEDRSLLVAVGRLVPVKGFQSLVQACWVLKTRGHSFRCCILGDGPLKNELQSQIDRLGLQDCVELRGGRSQSELAEWYRAADMTVLSSLSEGVPNVLLESLACGTPFIATEVGGVPEIADPQHDRLVPPEKPVALADAVLSLLSTRSERLPARKFEPLAQLDSARHLAQVLEDVRAQRATTSAELPRNGDAYAIGRQPNSSPVKNVAWTWRPSEAQLEPDGRGVHPTVLQHAADFGQSAAFGVVPSLTARRHAVEPEASEHFEEISDDGDETSTQSASFEVCRPVYGVFEEVAMK